MDDERNELRALVEASRDGRGYARLKSELKERIAGYVERSREQGETMDSLASGLGIAKSTLERWRKGGQRALVAVRVKSPRSGFIVRGPGSISVEGLSVEQLSELVRRLL